MHKPVLVVPVHGPGRCVAPQVVLLGLVGSVILLIVLWLVVLMPTLLERGISIDIINDYSSVEKGPGRPPHWEMVFWWTRKPLTGTRAVIATSLLPDNVYRNMK